MKNTRKLALRREVVAELEAADLAGVVAGDRPTFTCFSCMTYISCFVTACIVRETVICEA